MYKEFFSLSAEPFRVTPDPGFLYLTDQHKEALAAIIYGIARRKGFVCITGEVGVGKTTILKSYLDQVDEPGLKFVFVYNPNVSFQTLLKHIFKETGIHYPGEDIAGMVDTLRAYLQEHHQRRETLVLLIDEAQNMPIGTLENLRMLSNLETNTEKLVQIILVGQPELDNLLAERQLRQLESRIAVRTRLGPLSKADSVAYIKHRLKCVALSDQPVFTDGAIAEIARAANGIPRRINVLADNCLLHGFGQKQKPVSAKLVKTVAQELRYQDHARDPRTRKAFHFPWKAVGIGAGALAASAIVVAGGLALMESEGDGLFASGKQGTETAEANKPSITATNPPAPPQILPQSQPLAQPQPLLPQPLVPRGGGAAPVTPGLAPVPQIATNPDGVPPKAPLPSAQVPSDPAPTAQIPSVQAPTAQTPTGQPPRPGLRQPIEQAVPAEREKGSLAPGGRGQSLANDPVVVTPDRPLGGDRAVVMPRMADSVSGAAQPAAALMPIPLMPQQMPTSLTPTALAPTSLTATSLSSAPQMPTSLTPPLGQPSPALAPQSLAPQTLGSQALALQNAAPAPALATEGDTGVQLAASTPTGLSAKGQPLARRTMKVAARGDTLAGLTLQVYGRMDQKTLQMVQAHNPAITDVNRILVGQVIEFPIP